MRARQRAHALVEANDPVGAGKVIDAFHSELCATRVLDPACGTGNFLYVALDMMARIEDEVLTLRHALEKKGFGTVSIFSESVNPRQFLGIEREAALHLAGFVAEIIENPESSPTGCTDDVWTAFQLVAAIGHGRHGFTRLVLEDDKSAPSAVADRARRRGTAPAAAPT